MRGRRQGGKGDLKLVEWKIFNLENDKGGRKLSATIFFITYSFLYSTISECLFFLPDDNWRSFRTKKKKYNLQVVKAAEN